MHIHWLLNTKIVTETIQCIWHVKKSSEHVIKLLVNAFLMAAQQRIAFYCFPLNLACRFGQSVLVINLLINAYPLAFTYPDHENHWLVYEGVSNLFHFDLIHIRSHSLCTNIDSICFFPLNYMDQLKW
jgi:hypothetical protein